MSSPKALLKLVAADRTVQRLAALIAVLGLLFGVLAAIPATASADDTGTSDPSASAPATSSDAGAFSATKSLTRTYYDASGALKSDDRNVTVTADKTTNIQAHERIKISWKGAHPTGGRALNPFGVNGINQEYPVMIMECRGLDDASLPADQQLSPDTCWTSTFTQRSTFANPDHATWLFDAKGPDPVTDPADAVGGVTGIDPGDLDPTACQVSPDFAYHITPYVSVDKTTYDACSAGSMTH